MSDRVFIVDESRVSTTAAPPPTLGHVRRECNACHAPWELGQENCPKCHSVVFDEVYVPPTLLERVGNRITGIGTPEKPKGPHAPALLMAEVHGLVATIEHCRDEIARVDELVGTAVRDGIEEMQQVHGILHQATFTTGDASIQNVRHLSLGLRSAQGALAGAIDTLEDTL